MTPMVATSVVLHLGRLACAYFYTSAHLIRQAWTGKGWSRSDVTGLHFIAVLRNEIAHFLAAHEATAASLPAPIPRDEKTVWHIRRQCSRLSLPALHRCNATSASHHNQDLEFR